MPGNIEKNDSSTTKKRRHQQPLATMPKHPTSNDGDIKRRRVEDEQVSSSPNASQTKIDLLQKLDSMDKRIQELANANVEVISKLQSFQTSQARQKMINQTHRIEELKGRISTHSLDHMQSLLYSRSAQFQIPLSHIEPYMTQLESASEEIASLMADDEDHFTQPSSPVTHARNPDLFKLIKRVILSDVEETEDSWNEYVTRGMVVASVSDWVFADSFLNFSSGNEDEWQEIRNILVERGGNDFVPLFDALRQDVQYNLSRKQHLIEVILPSRAADLAHRLANALLPFVSTTANEQRKFPLSNSDISPALNLWLAKIRTMFLDALNFTVQLKQQRAPIVLVWPKKNALFESGKMRALNSGPSDAFDAREVVLTIMPTAMIQESETMREKVFSKAVVYLRRLDERSTTPRIQRERQLRKIANVQYSEDTTTILCSDCGVNKIVFDAKKQKQICKPCLARKEKESAKASKIPIHGVETASLHNKNKASIQAHITTSKESTDRESTTARSMTDEPKSHARIKNSMCQRDDAKSTVPSRPTTPLPDSDSDDEDDDGDDDEKDATFRQSIRLSSTKKLLPPRASRNQSKES